MGTAVQGMPLAMVALRHLQNSIMAAACFYSTFSSRQGILLIMSGNSIGQRSFNPAHIRSIERNHLVELPFGTGRFPAAEMAFHTFGAHDFTGSGYVEAFLGSFMSFYLWH